MNVFSYDNKYSASIAARTNDFTGSDLRELVRVATLQVCYMLCCVCQSTMCSWFLSYFIMWPFVEMWLCLNVQFVQCAIIISSLLSLSSQRSKDVINQTRAALEADKKAFGKPLPFLSFPFFCHKLSGAFPLLLFILSPLFLSSSFLSSPLLFFPLLSSTLPSSTLLTSPLLSSQPNSHILKFGRFPIIVYSSFLSSLSLLPIIAFYFWLTLISFLHYLLSYGIKSNRR